MKKMPFWDVIITRREDDVKGRPSNEEGRPLPLRGL